MDIVQAIMFTMPMAKFSFSGERGEAGWTYDQLVWDDLFFPKPTEAQLQEWYKLSVASIGNDYRVERSAHYPTAEQQLAIIYDLGIEGWKAYIDNVKKNIPKPKVE